jgi:hypothetical protein
MAGDPSSSSIEGDLNGIDREGRHVRQAWPRAHVSFFMAAEMQKQHIVWSISSLYSYASTSSLALFSFPWMSCNVCNNCMHAW